MRSSRDTNHPKMWSRQPEIFNAKFKRKPKEWTIEDIHELWLRTEKRADIMRSKSRKIWHDVIEAMQPGDEEPFKLYFEEDDCTYVYEFSWTTAFNSYGVSNSLLNFSENPKIARDEKIEFLINNEEACKWGEIYRKNKKNQSRLHHIVKGAMVEMISDKLYEHFKDNEERPTGIFKISISDKHYYIRASGDGLVYKNYGVKYEFQGEVLDNDIKLSGNLVY